MLLVNILVLTRSLQDAAGCVLTGFHLAFRHRGQRPQSLRQSGVDTQASQYQRHLIGSDLVRKTQKLDLHERKDLGPRRMLMQVDTSLLKDLLADKLHLDILP